MKNISVLAKASLFLVAVIYFSCSKNSQDQSRKISLKDGWFIQSSKRINSSGKKLSVTTIDLSSWYKASVPSTVMGVLTANGLYKDIFTGDNFKLIDKEPFNSSWWYRTEFNVSKLEDHQFAHLQFDGISYYANIWFNGKLIASKDSTYGSFRRFDFDVTPLLKESNILAVEILRQQPGDFGIGFADWNPRPPDKNMGLWREVTLNITGDVSIRNSTVESKVNTQTFNEASLSVKTELTNYSDKAVTGKLNFKIDSLSFEYPVTIEARQTKSISITDQDIEGLHIKNPRLWWCNNLGKPELYSLQVSFNADNFISDKNEIRFGIRQIEDYMTREGYRGYKLNGKKVLIKGAGWTDDIFLRDTEQSNRTQIQYVKDMNLNTIRLENIWGTSQNIYDLCDANGILVMTGWSCQWEWDNYLGKPCDDFGGIQTDAEMDLIATSLNDQVKWLRHHPSIITWFVGSDKLPKPELEKKYQQLLKQIDDRPYLAAASAKTSSVADGRLLK